MQTQNDATTATLCGADFLPYEPDVLDQLELDGWSPAQVTALTLTELKISAGGFIIKLEQRAQFIPVPPLAYHKKRRLYASLR